MSKIEVDAITEQSGSTLTTGGGAGKTVVVDATTVTLGRCGGTVALASGASQTGFGRSGSVNWDTTPKTATFTGVSGNGYFVNTTAGVVTVNLPASPSAGDIVSISDYAGTADTNNITIGRNGSNINGAASDQTISQENSAGTFVYVDGTQGWKATETSNLSDIELQPQYVTATGGTIITCGNFKTHIFTSPGAFCVSNAGNAAGSSTVESVVIGAGGGAGGNTGGGGGAGKVTTTPSSAVPASSITITVGAGGAGTANSNAANGSASTFGSIVSSTFGNGGGGEPSNNAPGGASGQPFAGGLRGNAPSGPGSGGGGGGAGAVGSVGGPVGSTGGPGGVGLVVPQVPASYGTTGPSPGRWFGGGGQGGPYGSSGATIGGGAGGGGPGGATTTGSPGTAGTVNTGGGGGGGSESNGNGMNGGSGIVVIKYKFQN